VKRGCQKSDAYSEYQTVDTPQIDAIKKWVQGGDKCRQTKSKVGRQIDANRADIHRI
jgi:hypothetical protein